MAWASRTSEMLIQTAVPDVGHIEKIAAVFGDQAVDQGQLGTVSQEPLRQVRADESQPAGDQYAPAGKNRAVDGLE